MKNITKEDFNPLLLPDEFVKLYGGNKNQVQVYAGPARINIIGEHIDYNGGKVFPSAIDKYTYVAIRKTADTKITYNDLKFPGTFSFDINDNFCYDKKNDYANYLNGILSIIKNRGYKFTSGFEVLIVSNVPPAGGISSSSALECAFAYAVSECFNFKISRKDIALIGQQSEHEFMNVNCGIMDQYIISTAKENTAELLDCAKVEHEYIPLELKNYCFVVMNTKKKRQLADSKYNERRSQCEKALLELKAAALPLNLRSNKNIFNTSELLDLCSISIEEFNKISYVLKDEVLLKRARHCVTENDRVIKSVEALKQNDLTLLGKYLVESHKSLKEDYEVTGIELDTLVESALKQKSCIGARMTGAGFGGCAIALVLKDNVQEFCKNVQEEYLKVIGYDCQLFTCSTSNGVFRFI